MSAAVTDEPRPTSTVTTFGLTHVGLAVASPERSFRFYAAILGARLLGEHAGREDDDLSGEDWLEWGTPGAHDVITLQREDPASRNAGVSHFGFRLRSSDDPEAIAAIVERAGGTVSEKGHFSSGDPVVFAQDPDGYEIEFWFEPDPEWRR